MKKRTLEKIGYQNFSGVFLEKEACADLQKRHEYSMIEKKNCNQTSGGTAMITVWNRKELLCTFDMKKQAEVRDILWKFDISYEMRVSDRADFFVGGKTTSTDADIDHQTEYLIYVKKEDYDRAMFLVQRNLKE